MAAEAGVDIVDCAIGSMSSMTSNPCMNSVVEALRGSKRDTGLDPEELTILSQYYEGVRKVYKSFESGMDAPNTEIYKYEIPGGQYSNLLAQVKEMGAGDNFEEIKQLYKEANHLLGNIVKVTPSSKVVGDFAIFMFKNGLNAENILTEGRELSYPDSVVEYFKGMIGQPEGGFPEELQRIVLKDQKAISVRPGSLLEPVDFDAVEAMLREKYYLPKMEEPGVLEQKSISYALYPRVYEDYCEHLEEYNDVSRLESHVYFYGLRKGEETIFNIGEGKDVIVKFVEMTEPDTEGMRTLAFEVNGSMREIKVLDKNLEVKADHRLKADKRNPGHLGSTIPGTVGNILVKEGDEVTVNMPLMTVEAMKMETTVVSKVNGKVDKIYVQEGDSVKQEDLLISFEIEE
jgi:pyruvate carboxylase